MTRVAETKGASKKRVVLAGCIAGLVSRFVIAPLDVVKIRLQLQPQPRSTTTTTTTNGPRPPTLYRGILPTIRTVIRQEGLTSLWKGNIPAELLYVTYGATQFLTYQQLNLLVARAAPKCPPSLQSFATGAGAGAIATTVTYPFDLLRTRFAAQASRETAAYSSLAYAVRHIAVNEGTSGFFRGLGATLTQIGPYMGLLFMTHEAVKVRLEGSVLAEAGYVNAVAGAVAGVVAKTGVFPLDTIRKRLQVQGPTRGRYVHGNIPVYVGIWGTARDVFRVEGVAGLYRGLWVSLLKAAPLTAVTMWSFETAIKALEAMEEKTTVL